MVFAINNVNANVNNAGNVLVNVAGMAVRGCANLVASIICDDPQSASKPEGKGKRLLQERCDHGLHECHHTRQGMWIPQVSLIMGQFLRSARLDFSLQLMTVRGTTSHNRVTSSRYLTSVDSNAQSLSSISFSNI